MSPRNSMMLALMIALLSGQRASAEEELHILDRPGYSRTPVTNEKLSAYIQGTAVQYARSGIVASRVGFYDLAFPRDSTEVRSMQGHGVIVVTAVVRDSTEVPLSRVYVRTRSRDFVLPQVFCVSSPVSPDDSLVVATLGRHRVDGMYLFPIHLRFDEGVLLVDFAAHRREFVLEKFPGDIPAMLSTLPRDRAERPPPLEEVRKLAQREYPGLIRFVPEGSAERREQ